MERSPDAVRGTHSCVPQARATDAAAKKLVRADRRSVSPKCEMRRRTRSRQAVRQGNASEAARPAPDKAHLWRLAARAALFYRSGRHHRLVVQPLELPIEYDMRATRSSEVTQAGSGVAALASAPERYAGRSQKAGRLTPLKVRVYGREGRGCSTRSERRARFDHIRPTPWIHARVPSAREVRVFGRANSPV